MAIIVGSGWKYFVDGIENPRVWGTFLWPLTFQDGLVSNPEISADDRFHSWRIPVSCTLVAAHGNSWVGDAGSESFYSFFPR